jgi:hypothetical protein
MLKLLHSIVDGIFVTTLGGYHLIVLKKFTDLFITKPNYSIRNTNDFLPQFAYNPPLFKAGTNVRYNNCAFILLGLAIEKLTGQDYLRYFHY